MLYSLWCGNPYLSAILLRFRDQKGKDKLYVCKKVPGKNTVWFLVISCVKIYYHEKQYVRQFVIESILYYVKYVQKRYRFFNMCNRTTIRILYTSNIVSFDHDGHFNSIPWIEHHRTSTYMGAYIVEKMTLKQNFRISGIEPRGAFIKQKVEKQTYLTRTVRSNGVDYVSLRNWLNK